MGKSFKSLWKQADAHDVKDILRARYEAQTRRERATIVKRMPPGVVYIKGRLVDQI